jgi:thioredoxin-dependent peroxiredoxin
MPVAVGTPAPEFSLPDENGKIHTLSETLGRIVVVYFYPRDDTPGCTTEACNFRDNYSDYLSANIVLLGISPDHVKSHLKFKQKYQLPFPLLADKDHLVCERYGVWGPKRLMGREYDGVLRTTFLIDPRGIIARVFENVRPAEHSAEVLQAVKALSPSG